MNARNSIFSESDFQRLSGMLDSPQIRARYGSLVAQLENELSRGDVVAPARVAADIVTMNSTVRIRDMKTDEWEIYTLAYPQEADINDGRLSVLAPLGMALLGAKVGDVVNVETPGGVRRVKIAKILYQPEMAGHPHL